MQSSVAQSITVYRNSRLWRKIILPVVILACCYLLFLVAQSIWSIVPIILATPNISQDGYISLLMPTLIALFGIVVELAILLVSSMYFRRRANKPALVVDASGIQITCLGRLGKAFVPWSEIAWISSNQISFSKFICIKLKNPERWFSEHYKGKKRQFWHYPEHAQLNISDAILETKPDQILLLIQQQYADQLHDHQVQVLLG